MEQIRQILERSAFGVCSYLGEKMGITSSRVRVYFIYLSLLTMGSPILLYLITAFWLNIRRYLKRGKNMIWD
ncbi:MAG: PspC family transcriptional regulator [Saprospiraceae bacterium]